MTRTPRPASSDLPGPLGAVKHRVPDAVHGQLCSSGGEDDARAVDDLDGVRRAAVVEPRLDLRLEAHRPAHDAQHPHEPVAIGRLIPGDGHEVDDLAHAGLGEEPGDEDGGVGHVQLPRDVVVGRRADAAVPAALRVEQRGEDARPVEARQAEPVDRAVGGDERRGLQVPDQSVIGDVGIRVSHRCPPEVVAPCWHAPFRLRP